MISICVPIYNTAQYLKRCIDSLLNQTYKNIEIILVNDGSTDDSGQICDNYQKKDSRVRVIHKPNGGEASARNAGLRAAQGEYIAFIDSDDEYYGDAMDTLLETLQKYNADFVVGGYIESGAKEHYAIPRAREYSQKDIAEAILNSCGEYADAYIFSTVNGKIFKKSIIEERNIQFNEGYTIGNDTIFICEYIRGIKKAVNTFSPVYIYYKYDISERIQGMSWYYPDTSIFFAKIGSDCVDILSSDLDEIDENIVAVRYMGLIKSLVGLTAYEAVLNIDLIKYIEFCRNKIAFFEYGAQLEMEKSLILDKHKHGIPYKIVSMLIAERRDKELAELFRIINRLEKIESVDSSKKIRRIINFI